MLTLNDFTNNVLTFGKISGRSSMVPEFLYQVQRDIMGLRPYWWAVDTTTLTTVASQVNYPLSTRVDGRKILVMNDETDDTPVDLAALAKHLWADPTPTESGTPYDYSFIGIKSCQGVPAANSTLSIVSSAAGDTSQTIILRGYVSGIERTESITLTGAVAVVSTLTYDSGSYIDIQKSATTTGTVTITAGAVTIATLPPEYLKLEIPWIRLRDVPGSVLTMRYWFYKRPKKCASIYEIPDFPEIAHLNTLLPGVLYYAHMSASDYQQADWYKGKMDEGIVKLNKWSEIQPHKIDIKGMKTGGLNRGRYPVNPATTYTMG